MYIIIQHDQQLFFLYKCLQGYSQNNLSKYLLFIFLQTVLHWGAKHGNAEIIKVFAGTYKVDVNAKTVGICTVLHY